MGTAGASATKKRAVSVAGWIWQSSWSWACSLWTWWQVAEVFDKGRTVVFLFQGLWRPRNLMNFYASCLRNPTGEQHSLDSTQFTYMLHRFWSCSVFTWILNILVCARVSTWIHSIWWTYSWCKFHSTFCIVYMLYIALLCLLRFTSSPPEPTGDLDSWMHNQFFGTHATLAAKRVTHTMERHVLEKIVEMTEIIRNHNIAKIKVDKFADLMSLTSFFDICASHKSSMQGVFHSYRILWFCRTLTIQSNTSRIFDISAVFVTFHSSYHILRSLVYHGSSRSMAEWHLNLKASIEPEAVPGQWMLMRWI